MARAIAAAAFAFLFVSTASAQTSGYNRADETTVNGVVRYVISAAAPDGTVGVHLELKTTDGPVRVNLAPALFIGMNDFSFLMDDAVVVRGAKVTRGADTAIWARFIVKDGKTLVLRNEDGTPRWANATSDDPDGCGVAHAPVR